MALACIAAELLAQMVTSFENGDLKKARDIQIRLIPVNTAVTSRFGIPGLKAALDLAGLYGGPVRPPLLPLDSRQKRELEKILKEAKILNT
jgi:4-hydroxy-2-oxoglutarate aldolase